MRAIVSQPDDPFLAEFDEGCVIDMKSVRAHGVSVHRVLVRQSEEINFRLKPSVAAFTLCLAGERKEGFTTIGGSKKHHGRRISGLVNYIPPDCEWSTWSVPTMPTEFSVVCIDDKSLISDRFPQGDYCWSPVVGCRDPRLVATLRKLHSLPDMRDDRRDLYASSLGVALVIEAEEALSSVRPKLATGGLSSYQERLVLDYINEMLGEKMTLEELADLVGLSRQHFCRAFKVSFQSSPYNYIINKRLHHARELLLTTGLSITEIALDCGFSSSSHFSDAFARHFGVTASQLRRSA